MGAMEDAANLFSAELTGQAPAPSRAPSAERVSSPVQVFDDHEMEGDPDAGTGFEQPDEGGDAAEEARERPRSRETAPKRGDDGRFLKNEGPIDDDEGEPEEGEPREDEEGEPEEGEDTGKPGDVDPEVEVTVKVDGEDRKVKLKEALEGYIRTETFHKRLTALDQEKQVVDRTRAEYQTGLQTLQETHQRLAAELKALEPAEPDWDKLYRENPNEAARQKIMWDRYKDGRAQLHKQQEDITNQQRAEQQRNLQQYVGKEAQKLIAQFPHWKDDKARERDQISIKNTLKDAGFSDQEISTVFDSRMVKIAMKAARFDRLSSKGIQPRKSTTRPMPSGSAASSRRSGSGQGNRAARVHSNDQSVDSAVDVFADILSRER